MKAFELIKILNSVDPDTEVLSYNEDRDFAQAVSTAKVLNQEEIELYETRGPAVVLNLE